MGSIVLRGFGDTEDLLVLGGLGGGRKPPTITGFAPISTCIGHAVTITGTDFVGATALSFHGTAATAWGVVSDTTIRAFVPVGATSGVITVTHPAGSVSSGPLLGALSLLFSHVQS